MTWSLTLPPVDVVGNGEKDDGRKSYEGQQSDETEDGVVACSSSSCWLIGVDGLVVRRHTGLRNGLSMCVIESE